MAAVAQMRTHPREGKIVCHIHFEIRDTFFFSLENRSRSDSHTSPPPHRGRRQIKHQTPNVEELVSKTRRKKKKKRTSQAALYGHQNNRSAEYIRYRADFSSREVCTAERASRSRKQQGARPLGETFRARVYNYSFPTHAPLYTHSLRPFPILSIFLSSVVHDFSLLRPFSPTLALLRALLRACTNEARRLSRLFAVINVPLYTRWTYSNASVFGFLMRETMTRQRRRSEWILIRRTSNWISNWILKFSLGKNFFS